jgi:hypothetical protein
MNDKDFRKLFPSLIRSDPGWDNAERPCGGPNSDIEERVNAAMRRNMPPKLRKMMLGMDDSSNLQKLLHGPASDIPDDDRDWMGFADDAERERFLQDIDTLSPEDFTERWGDHPTVAMIYRALKRKAAM